MLEFRILGPVEVHRCGVEVPLDGAKPRTVLTALLLAGDDPVPDARLRDHLWGDQPPTTATAQLYTYVSRLRKLLGGEAVIARRSHGYQLRPTASTFDLLQFEDHAGLGRAALAEGRWADAARLLRTALGLWRGDALTGVSEWLAAAEAPRLAEARLVVLEDRLAADLALGRHEQVEVEVAELVARYPGRERLVDRLREARSAR